MSIRLATPIIDLHKHDVAKLSAAMARRLALATAAFAGKSDAAEASVEDLIVYLPMRYEDRSNFIGIDKLYDGIEASVEIYVRVSGGFKVGKNRSPKAPPLYIFELSGGDADRTQKPVVVYWFLSGKQAPHVIRYYQERFARGTRLVAYGSWEWDSRRNTFALKILKPDELEILPNPTDPDTFGLLRVPDEEHPEPEDAVILKETGGNRRNGVGSSSGTDEDIDTDEGGDPALATVHTGRHVPIYRKFGPFHTKRLREIMFDIFKNLDLSELVERLPAGLVERNELIPIRRAVEEIHFPPAGASLSEYASFRSPAQLRMIFEELFRTTFALLLRRSERKKEPKGTVIEVTEGMKRRVADLLPFKLTEAQRRVVRQIAEDMTSESPMNRLVQGDVGSGKTIVAFIAMCLAAENGYQAALMAPTEILAEQHARNAERILGAAGLSIGLLIGSLPVAQKRKMHERIAGGDIQLIVGTQAVIQEAVQFSNLGLAVIDEQHRFGVLQRSALRDMGFNPDVLVMTATPIPRSLAMTVYGDLDVSVIDELPPGRTPVKTVVVGEDQREGVYRGIRREVELGRQVYIVYPLIEESEKVDLKAATKMYEELRGKIFPNFRVGLLHGKMKSVEKEQIMTRFVSGELQVLVSTTVIEVGVDVPNASLMVIEHAERFGLSQLHQLRGRVGRGAEKSFCVLLTDDKKTAVAKERLGIMEETNDGFRIAEKDLEIRGQGEIMGTRQSGAREFRIANIVRDFEILVSARAEAEQYLTKSPRSPETRELIRQTRADSRFSLAAIG
jgi:ATP-dependent DNA helicase RecG